MEERLFISGINTSVSISVAGGEFSIDGAPYNGGADVVSEGARIPCYS